MYWRWSAVVQPANQNLPAMSFKVRDLVNRQSKSARLFMFTCQCWKEVNLSVVWLVVNNERISVVGSTFGCLPPGDFRMLAKVFYPTGVHGRIVEKVTVFLKTELWTLNSKIKHGT